MKIKPKHAAFVITAIVLRVWSKSLITRGYHLRAWRLTSSLVTKSITLATLPSKTAQRELVPIIFDDMLMRSTR